MSDNPYASPTADVSRPATDEQARAEATRREHLSHEASIRGVGSLFMLVGGLVLLSGLLSLIGTVAVMSAGSGPIGADVFVLAGLTAIGGAQFWTGLSLRRLKRSWKIPAILFAILLLAGFPLGTLIGVYVLYLLLSAKGKMVLSDEYAGIRKATPHITYRTSIVVWFLLALLIGGLLLAVLIPAYF